MLCPTCSICWTQIFCRLTCSNFMQFCLSSFYIPVPFKTNYICLEEWYHVKSWEYLTVVFGALLGQVHHIRLPPFKPIYFPRCHNLNLFSVCPCNELFVGNSFSYITVTFEMSLWSFLCSLSNIFPRTRENGTKIQVVTSAWGIC
jgi:hypothetical protein